VLTLEVRQIEADALGRGLGASTVYLFVVHPDGHGDIHNDEAKRALGGVSGTSREQVLDGAASLETNAGAFLPPDNRAPLGVHKSLLENVVEDVLEVEETHGVADVDELGSGLLVSAGRLVIGDPELGRLGQMAMS